MTRSRTYDCSILATDAVNDVVAVVVAKTGMMPVSPGCALVYIRWDKQVKC